MNNEDSSISLLGQSPSVVSTVAQQAAHGSEQVDVLKELQDLWDSREASLSELCSKPSMQPIRVNPGQGVPYRRCVMAKTLALAAIEMVLCASVLSVMALSPDRWVMAYGWALVALSLFLLARCHKAYVSHKVRSPLSCCVRPGVRKRPTPIDLRQVCVLSLSILIVVVFAACTPVGDGWMMSKVQRSDRIETIESVNQIISRI